MRKTQKELLKDYIQGELISLQFPNTIADAVNGHIMKEVPYVKVTNLCDMICDYLDRLKQEVCDKF